MRASMPMLQETNKSQFTLYVFVAVLFVVGVIFGGLMVNALTLEQQQELASDVSQYINLVNNGTAADASHSFWERMLFHGKWLFLLWILGITVVGVPFVLALDFLKGALVGFAIGTLISQHAWKGVLFSLVSVAPPNLIVVPVFMVISVAAISFSTYVVKNRLFQQKGSLVPQIAGFSSTALLMLLMLAGAALLEAYISPVLMQWVAPVLAASQTS
ncbi:stage II sporulation protein M [Paenibacillus sp. NEAU-GSW1]|uniref:stage II sporulation protein M n=1 Tax=Paenibacillus sp. NEAU-GSW1 TaxID=2682486 RepID=UPI0012E322FB|nr:stage II sporulation protein M [Paenibacillus sp. NEAU-GSW1]MUT65556.1 stage II sporulation protein M [Paenibacillus sp. NEAU-GSW1]